MRPPEFRLFRRPLVVDMFAGGGGASTGIEWALGRSPDVAVNHDPEAVALHAANHPETRHLVGNVWDYDPRSVANGEPVDLLWASPTCTHFSRAKGGPLDRTKATRIRGLAWSVVRWAKSVRPRVIVLENVEEFQGWGPLTSQGKPCPRRKGQTFRAWASALRRCGYDVEWRELRACDYGAPTTRRRLFVIARCDGERIVWPEPTHGRGLAPYRAAAECIEWHRECMSIFERRRPLAEATQRRIARGIERFVLGSPEPFIVGDYAPTLVQTGYGERPGQAPRALDLHAPLGTVVAGGSKHALVAAFLAKHYGGNETPGLALTLPMSTITTQDHHALVTASSSGRHVERVCAFLTRYNGQGIGQEPQLPLGTVTTRDRFGLVTVRGESYAIADIGMRMLAPRELYRAQGFPDSYRIEIEVGGRVLSQSAQIRMCGNSVSPHVAAALVRANVAGRMARRVAS